MRRLSLLTVAATAVLVSGACSGLGSIGDILGAIGQGGARQQQQGQIEAEIQSVDRSSQRINIRTQNGQNLSVRYDSQTMVVYRQQQFPVTSLQRGDIVTIQVQQVSQNELYASRIDVRQSVN